MEGMIRLLRICGFLLMGLGTLIALSWFVAPLRQVWPMLLALPLPVQIGLGTGLLGLVIVFGSLLYERWESRDEDRQFREDE